MYVYMYVHTYVRMNVFAWYGISVSSADPFLEMEEWVDEPDDVIEHETLLMSPGPTMERSIANPLGLSVDEARSGPMKGLEKPLPLLYPGSTYLCVFCICCEVYIRMYIQYNVHTYICTYVCVLYIL